MSRSRDTAKVIVSSVVLACIAFFFYRAFKLNWATVRAQGLQLDYRFLLAALLCIVATYLVPTYGWMITINSLSSAGRLSFSQSIAVVNASSLTKYIPGKIWSYALQMYWLSAAGFAKSLVVYVNAINLFISLVTSLMVGLAFLLPSGDRFPLSLTVGALVALVAIDVVALKFHDASLRWLIALYNRFSKRKLEYFDIPTRLVVELHLLHLFAAVAFGLAAYFVCLGIGYSVRLREAPLLMASLLLSDTIAFAALIVPGGLGVREGIMYAMLGGVARGPVALILPVATRVMHMIVDVALGGTALRLLRKLNGRSVSGTADVGSRAGEQ
jgi:uncharacterized membrane protein YbhN (UPF0104 family)